LQRQVKGEFSYFEVLDYQLYVDDFKIFYRTDSKDSLEEEIMKNINVFLSDFLDADDKIILNEGKTKSVERLEDYKIFDINLSGDFSLLNSDLSKHIKNIKENRNDLVKEIFSLIENDISNILLREKLPNYFI